MASNSKSVILPVTGMTCANCVLTVERGLKKEAGVLSATVNLSSERATVELDPQKVGLTNPVDRLNRIGYEVAHGQADFSLRRMSDDSDARSLEKVLLRLDGVLSAEASLVSSLLRTQYIPTLVNQSDLRKAVSAAGFEIVEQSGNLEDAEAQARQFEIKEQRRYLIISTVFTLPLFFFHGARSGLDIGHVGNIELGKRLYAPYGNARAILCWLAIFCGCFQGIAQ
jgi:Cu+-exporting ATPase